LGWYRAVQPQGARQQTKPTLANRLCTKFKKSCPQTIFFLFVPKWLPECGVVSRCVGRGWTAIYIFVIKTIHCIYAAKMKYFTIFFSFQHLWINRWELGTLIPLECTNWKQLFNPTAEWYMNLKIKWNIYIYLKDQVSINWKM